MSDAPSLDAGSATAALPRDPRAAGEDDPLALAREVLRERFGHADFRPGQDEAVRRILAGDDVTIVMPTGAGKSACFQVPALVRDGLTLVVSPLIALMKDQVEALEARGLPATFINSTLSQPEQRDRLARIARGEMRLVYVAPERLVAPSFLRAMEARPPRTVAVDEAHCISQWGHDFRPSYLGVAEFLDRVSGGDPKKRPQVLALTGTATPRVRQDIAEHLGIPPGKLFMTGFRRPNLRLVVRRCDRKAERLDQIAQVASGVKGSGIVYCATRREVEEVAQVLRDLGEDAGCYHAGMRDEERSAEQEAWLAGRTRIVVATNAFGMGIDKPDVRFIVHHSMPGSVESYYQEAGRAGRDGRTSWCLLLHGAADRHLHEFFLDGSCPTEESVLAAWAGIASLRSARVDLSIADLAGRAGISEMAFGGALRILEQGGLVERPDGAREVNEDDGKRSRVRGLVVPDAAIPQATLRGRLSPLLKASHDRRQRGLERIAAMERYAYGRACRHRALIRYFGDDLEAGSCAACDSCCGWDDKAGAAKSSSAGGPKPARTASRARPAIDLDEARPMALRAVADVHRRFGMQMARLVLRGSGSKKITKARLEGSEAFGAFARWSDDQVDAVLLALQDEGLVESTGGIRPVILLTEEGRMRLGG
jgi:ATP-dependent DNA helicase RecQ